MGNPVYTYADILIAPYKLESITNLKITQELNEHGKLYINGVIPEENVDEYVENTGENEAIEVHLKNEGGTVDLFKGIVTNIVIHATADVREITIEALSKTFLMDIKKKRRSFQDKNMLYSKIVTNINNDYQGADTIDKASQGKAIGGLIVQYDETDWEFIKRIASHFNAPLIPKCGLDGIKYYIGAPDPDKKYSLEEFNYSIKKDIKSYKTKSENDIQGIKEQSLISYEITTGIVLSLGDTVEFKNKLLYVFKVETEIKDGILLNKYILRDKEGLSRRKIYNNSLKGASLFGQILAVSKDMVKVKLKIDSNQSAGEAMWFPYSTVYSSPDGSGWYCMPEIGDQVRLYFPDEKEQNAFTASSVNLTSSNPQQRSNPAIKSIGTKYGKQIVFKQGAVEIIGNGKMLMRLTDDGGIEIKSNKKISLSASDDIQINGGGKVLIQGGSGIDLKQGDTSLNILDDVTISGSKVNIE